MTPSIGRIVHYCLRAQDAEAINRKRAAARQNHRFLVNDCAGAQQHVGNDVREGQTLPMMIVAIHGNGPDACVNGQLYLDGNDSAWLTSVKVGEGPGMWSWPQREPTAADLGAAIRAAGERPMVVVPSTPAEVANAGKTPDAPPPEPPKAA